MPLTNKQYDEIMRTYQERQLSRQRLISARKKELYHALPRLAELDGQIASLSVRSARELLDGGDGSLLKLKQEISALSRQKQQILDGSGYPSDFLDPPYVCPACRDTGYVNGKRCHCLRQAVIDLIYAQSNLHGILDRENFDTFSLKYYDRDEFAPDTKISSYDAAASALAACRRFADQFDDTFENILLFGSTGVGKTFLSNCIAKALLDSGHSVIYFSAQRLFDTLAKHAFGKDGQDTIDYENIFNCDLLIIDDLGTEMTNYFTVSQFFICLNERILNRRSTLISSNLELQDIASLYSERISSRISDCFILLRLFGSDIRIRKKLMEENNNGRPSLRASCCHE